MSVNPPTKSDRTPLFVLGGLCGCLVLLGVLIVAGVAAFGAFELSGQAATPTIAQVKQAPTIAPPTVAPTILPTTQPTAVPPPSTTVQSAPTAPASQPTAPALACGNNVVCNAIAKTRAETNFSTTQLILWGPELANSAATLPIDQLANDRRFADIAGQDKSVTLKGPSAAAYAGKGATQFEYHLIGGKIYAHGPASPLQAPDNQWYLLTDTKGLPFNFDPHSTLDRWTVITNGWQGYTLNEKMSRMEIRYATNISTGTR